jgi:hypothetical protein
MLCSLPARAQAPIVPGWKWTFAAPRISAASDSVIQSRAAIDQSLVGAAGFDLSVALESAGFDSAELVALSPSVEAFFEPPAARRSFFAQPDPLNTIAGGANDLRMVSSAPHDGQNFGPLSLIP